MKCGYTGRKLFILCYFLYGFLYNAWDHNFRSSFHNHTESGEKPSLPTSVLCCLYTQCLPRGRKVCKSVSFWFYFLLVFFFFFFSLFMFMFMFIYTTEADAKEMFQPAFCTWSHPFFLGAVILQPRVTPLLAFLPWRRLTPELQCAELHGDRGVKLSIRSFFLDF